MYHSALIWSTRVIAVLLSISTKNLYISNASNRLLKQWMTTGLTIIRY